MNTLEAIAQRRSIRKFQDKPVADDLIVKILEAAIQAPSGKNRQPWRFIVVKEERRAEMLRVMREAIEALKAQGIDTGSSLWTAQVMEHAPVTIFIFNPEAQRAEGTRTFGNLVDAQSIGAAIQNMLLAALEYELGTLWICDVFYANDALCDWLGRSDEMIAAVSIGYPAESPQARPRKTVAELTEWL